LGAEGLWLPLTPSSASPLPLVLRFGSPSPGVAALGAAGDGRGVAQGPQPRVPARSAARGVGDAPCRCAVGGWALSPDGKGKGALPGRAAAGLCGEPPAPSCCWGSSVVLGFPVPRGSGVSVGLWVGDVLRGGVAVHAVPVGSVIPAVLLSPCSVPSVLSVLSSPVGTAMLGSGSQRRCVVATSPAAAELRGVLRVGNVSAVLGAVGVPVVFGLPQIQSRSCASEEEKLQEASSSQSPRWSRAMGRGKRAPWLRKQRGSGAEVGAWPQRGACSARIALCSPAPSLQTRALGGVAPPPVQALLSQRQPPRSRHGPRGAHSRATTHPSPLNAQEQSQRYKLPGLLAHTSQLLLLLLL